MKKIEPSGRIAIFGIGIFLATIILGCGVKTAPVPPKSVPPSAITDLRYSVEQGQAVLRWSIPKGKAAGTAGLAGFLVYQAVTPASEPSCDGCPLLFRRVADIPAAPLLVGDGDQQEAVFQKALEPGFHHTFKVVAYAKDGNRGPDSNQVAIK